MAAAPVNAAPLDAAERCPVTTVPFTPPLDQPLQLTRTITRSLAQGEFRQTVTYRVRFSRSGRGYRMQWQQTGQQAAGPPQLLRLLALQDDAGEGETLDFTLDENGALLGVTEAPDAAQRLAEALARLRNDPAMATRSPREQAMIDQMLDRMAALQPAERADMHLAKAVRLLVVAGRDCSGSAIIGHDGSEYRIVRAPNSDEQMSLASSNQDQRADGSTISITSHIELSIRSGLAQTNRQLTHTVAGGVARDSQDMLQLQREP